MEAQQFANMILKLILCCAILKVSSSETTNEDSIKAFIEETLKKQVNGILENLLKPVRDEYLMFAKERLTMSLEIIKLKEESKTEIQKISSELSKMNETLRNSLAQQKEAMENISELKRELLETKSNATETVKELEAAISQLRGRECFRHAKNVESCIQTQFCGFCVKDDFTYAKCDLPENLSAKGCSKSEIIHTRENINSTSPSKIHLCPGMKRNVTVTLENSNLSVDLYLLLDHYYQSNLKSGFQDFRAFENFTVAVRNILPDFTIGWGVTGDKQKRPFGWDKSFSFKNVLPLTKELETFIASIKQEDAGLNQGDREDGQLEGMYQAAICKEQIGWRNNSRKILFVASIYPYHVRGDGAEGNITEPFDGLCALNGTGYYGNELTQDYPSEDQIVQVMKEQNVIVLFAVNEHLPLFKSLADRLNPHALLFTTNSKNRDLRDILTQAYRKLNSVVVDGTSEDIRVESFSTCSGEREEGSNCEDGNRAIRIEVEMLSCPSNESNRNQVLKITHRGSPTIAPLEIPIHLICNCNS